MEESQIRKIRLKDAPLKWVFIGILALYLVPTIIKFLINFSVDYLWFASVGFISRYLKVILVKVESFLAAGILFTIIAFINNLITKRNISSKVKKLYLPDIHTGEISIAVLSVIILFAIIFGLTASNWWEEFLKFYNFEKLNFSDPIFHKDISFYLFQLPIYNFIKLWTRWLLIFIFLFSLVFYFLSNSITFSFKSFFAPKNIRLHLGIVLFLLFINYAAGFYLKRYELLWNQHSIIKGASYTDVNAHILAYNVMIIIAALFALSFLYWIYSGTLKTTGFAGISYLIVLLSLNYIYPFFLQKIVVDPNEIEKEKRYINWTIKYTRLAYNLDKVKIRYFEPQDKLAEDIFREEKVILKNIRIWDWRPLKLTFKQLQEIRPYYIFSDVDVDRYYINGDLRQIMLAAREITHSNLPKEARNWINRHLKYTHGYGIVMVPVSEVNQEGLPQFYIKDIPPVSIEGLKIKRPEIYFGTTMQDYVIVNTKVPEFDYPAGESNVYSYYKGDGGVHLDASWKKMLFSIYLGNIKILFSDFITHSSKVMIRRNIVERVKEVAPFLLYDNNPYIALINERLYWIVDAYTFTDKFPYSEKFNDDINYIRNSIKVLIDAYTGKMKFYIIDEKDPIAMTYKNIFPYLFNDINTLNDEFKKHFRYPMDIFMIQSEIYTKYHMTDPENFYNKEDLWDFPTQIYDENEILMTGYYLINRIEKNGEPEFLNIIPFTPSKKQNMIAWLAARCDWSGYGELIVFRFPKKYLIYGPMQIEARIDQHPEISRLISLWGQKGSRVIRGDLLVIPIKNTILYVEPLFLQAEKQELPEIKRIIVVYKDNIAMASSLEDAMRLAIEGEDTETLYTSADTSSIAKLIDNALEYYNKGTMSLKKGDWTKYGENMNKLKSILEQIKHKSR